MVRGPSNPDNSQRTRSTYDNSVIGKRKVLTAEQMREVDAGRAIIDSHGEYHPFGSWRPFEMGDFMVVLLISAALLYLAA